MRPLFISNWNYLTFLNSVISSCLANRIIWNGMRVGIGIETDGLEGTKIINYPTDNVPCNLE